MSAIYAGPQCPSCDSPLEPEQLRAGLMTCPFCRTVFEATPFQARDRLHGVVQTVTETPDGVAAACANHARNAAVTNCTRCGLFICALCEMNVGEGSYCPSCFDRVRGDNSVATTRYRDYASMAIAAAVVGLLCAFLPVGPFAMAWGFKGVRQRRTEGSRPVGPVIAIILGVLETLAFLAMVTFLIIGIVTEGKP